MASKLVIAILENQLAIMTGIGAQQRIEATKALLTGIRAKRSAIAAANGKRRGKPKAAAGKTIIEPPPGLITAADLPPKPPAICKEVLDTLETRLRSAGGFETYPGPGLLNLSPIIRLIDNGYSLDHEIIPTIAEMTQHGKRVPNWSYYAAAVRRNRPERHQAGHVNGAGKTINGAAGQTIASNGLPVSVDVDDRIWRVRIELMRQSGSWQTNWGPRPGSDGCMAPEELLREARPNA